MIRATYAFVGSRTPEEAKSGWDIPVNLGEVAHSMGGLVSRYAVINNYKKGNRYIKHFVTISSPFEGMRFAESGVKHTKTVVPSWIDMVPNSDFQDDIFKAKLRGKIPYMLVVGDKSKRSLIPPAENDGTVSVASVTRNVLKQGVVQQPRTCRGAGLPREGERGRRSKS